ncbi:MAG: protein kinase [Pyrinomonadaceae bacterium]
MIVAKDDYKPKRGQKSFTDFVIRRCALWAEHHRMTGLMDIGQGTRLGRYEVRSRIGAGGMGEVYLAEDVRLGRRVALKILPGAMASDAQRMGRFTQEARATSALNHPNIITIHEIDQTNSLHFIVTEFIDGVTLRERMKEARMEVGEALAIAVQVVSALAAAHEAGVVHRDIKPENVMVRRDALVKVLDFGIAKLMDKPSGSRDRVEDETMLSTGEGVVIGTSWYMSPEQARAQGVDARTDLWSVGVMLYEMLCGQRPFVAETFVEVLALILRVDPVPLALCAPGVPAEIDRIVSKTLAKNREDRYQTAHDLLTDLRRLQRRLEFKEQLEQQATADTTGRPALDDDENPKSQADTVVMDSDSLELLSASGAARTGGACPNNLSAQVTLLVGREIETAEIEQMLRREDVRLVTLTGIGGTGKTRLAQWVARDLLREFADGVFFIDLSAVSEPGLVASAVAQPLGVKEAGGVPLTESLKEYVREKQMLLVLDNFEQVAEAAPFVAELLSQSTRLKALVTSRVSLRLSAEHEYTVPPLALPGARRLPPLNELANYAAIALFVKRAQAVKPAFVLTEENAREVVAVCRRLDGLPLAIELAAARIKLLSPQAILTRLEHSLKLLTGGARDLPARQQTMRGAISWSYDLLDESERRLLNRLSVFAGGMTIEAAEEVCEESGGRLTAVVEVLDGIASLVDKSLLVQKEQADGESRFRMLEVVREYATERLEESGEAEAVRERHAGFYLALAEEGEAELLGGAKVAEWLDRLEEEHDNLRAALRWLMERDAGSVLRLAGAARPFWERRGHLTEGRAWLEGALARGGMAQAQPRAKALIGAAQLAWQQGELAAARNLYEEALRLSREAGDRRLIAISSRGLGTVAFIQGNVAAARSLLEEALSTCREINDTRGVATSLTTLGEMARTEGKLAVASALYRESVALYRQLGNQYGVCANLLNLGAVACLEKDLEAANACYREAIVIARQLGDKVQVAYSLQGFGALLVARDEMEKAARLFGAATRLHQSIGYEPEPQDREFTGRYAAEALAALGKEAYAAAQTEGRALRMREAVALALEAAGDT